MATIAIVALCLVGGFVALVAVPIQLHLTWDTAARERNSFRLTWLFGLVHPQFRAIEERKKPGKVRAKRRPKRTRKRSVWPRLKAALRTSGFPATIARFLRGALRAVSIQQTRIQCSVGLEDPADTGWFLAMAAPALSLFNASRTITLEPDFNGESLSCRGEAVLRLQPLRLIATTIVFFCSFATIRAVVRAAGTSVH